MANPELNQPDPDTVLVFYTGTLITPDGSDTNGYGEPCEDGQGYTIEDGWVDPDWSLFVVWETREDVTPDEVTREDVDEWHNGDLARAILRTIEDRLGVLDHQDGSTFYAADSITDYSDGQSITLAAHLWTPTGEQFSIYDIDQPTTKGPN